MRDSEPSSESFAALLRRLRRAVGLTQEELAESARLSWRSVSDLERGATRNPHRDTIALLSDALGIDGDERAGFEAAARHTVPTDQAGPRMPSAPPESPETRTLSPKLPRGFYLGAIPTSRMVAREAESGRVMAALNEAATGQGRLVMLAGEPGVGKTRLAQEATIQAREMGFVVLIGRCYEEHAASPFFPFLEALAAAWAAAPPSLREEASARYGDLGRLVRDPLLPVPSADDDPRPRVLAAVAEFLRDLAAETPLALLVDDLHWVDSAGLDLFAHLARALHGRRMFILGSYRDLEVVPGRPLAAAIANLSRESLVEVVTLSPLSVQGTALQISAYLGLTAVPENLAALIHARTSGNPFFTAEVLKALVEQDAIDQDGLQWDSTAVQGLQAPFSIRAVVTERVGLLSPAARDLLHLAGVMGQEFELDVLLAASDQGEDVVLTAMDAVLAARLVEERRYGRYERYAFVHELVARTLCDELPRYRLRRLHLRAAKALERARGERPDTAAEVARHFIEGGDEARAVRYLELAGDHAARLYALDQAVDYYQSALDIRRQLGDLASAAILQRKMGAALATAMKLDEARAVLNAARTLLEEGGDTAELA
ncbi:MAG: ATP-binding protein, partial [Chloroflexota bacterium]